MSLTENEIADIVYEVATEIGEDLDDTNSYRADQADYLLGQGSEKLIGKWIDYVLDNFDDMWERYTTFNKEEDLAVAMTESLVTGHWADIVHNNPDYRDYVDDLTDKEYDDLEDARAAYRQAMGGRRPTGQATGGSLRNHRSGGRFQEERRPRTRSQGSHRNGPTLRKSGMGSSSDRPRGRQPSGSGRQTPNRQTKAASAIRNANDMLSGLRGEVTGSEVEEPTQTTQHEVRTVSRNRMESTPQVEGPDLTREDPYSEFYQDGCHFYVASKTDLQPDAVLGDNQFPGIPSFYDVNRFLRYLSVEQSTNKVTEVFIEMNDSNRYLQSITSHERQNEAPVDIFVRTAKPTDEIELEDVPAEPTTASLSDVLRNTLYNPSKSRPILSSKEEINAAERMRFNESSENSILTSYFSRSVVTLNTRGSGKTPEEALEDAYRWIRRIVKQTDYQSIHRVVNELKDNGPIELFNEIDKRLSVAVQRCIRYQWQVNLSGFRFADHGQKILKAIENVHGSTVLHDFHSNVRAAIVQALMILDDSTDETSDLVDEDVKSKPPVIVFVDSVEVVSINMTIDQIGIGTQLDEQKCGVVVLDGSATVGLKNALNDIYRKLNLSGLNRTAAVITIVTLDGTVIDVYPYRMSMLGFVMALSEA